MSRLNVANFRHPDATADNINLTSTGRVGIGTSSPDSILDLEGAAPTITLNDTNGADDRATLQSTGGALILTARDGTADGEIIFKKFDGTTTDETARITNTGNLQFDSGYGSVATAFGVRAWVNFNGKNTVSIRDDGNVSSITDEGAGLYRINFTTAMPDGNYAIVGSSGEDTNGSTPNHHGFRLQRDTPLTTDCEIATCNTSGTPTDHEFVCCVIVR